VPRQHYDVVGDQPIDGVVERGVAQSVEPAIASISEPNDPQPTLSESSAALQAEIDQRSSAEAVPHLNLAQVDGLRFQSRWSHAAQHHHALHPLVDESPTSSTHNAESLYRILEDRKPDENTAPVFNRDDARSSYLNPQSTPWQSHQDNLAALMRNLSLLNSSTTHTAADGIRTSDQQVNNLIRQLRSLLDPHSVNAINIDTQQPTLHHAHQHQQQSSHLHLHQQSAFPSQQHHQQQHQHFAPYQQYDEYQHANSVSTRSSLVPRSHSMPSFNSLATASCLNHGCTWVGPVDHLGMHQHDCTLQQTVCRYQKIGCNFRGTRQQISDHLTQAMPMHLELSEQKIDELQTQVKSTYFSMRFSCLLLKLLLLFVHYRWIPAVYHILTSPFPAHSPVRCIFWPPTQPIQTFNGLIIRTGLLRSLRFKQRQLL
jgi:hypothetical protein